MCLLDALLEHGFRPLRQPPAFWSLVWGRLDLAFGAAVAGGEQHVVGDVARLLTAAAPRLAVLRAFMDDGVPALPEGDAELGRLVALLLVARAGAEAGLADVVTDAVIASRSVTGLSSARLGVARAKVLGALRPRFERSVLDEVEAAWATLGAAVAAREEAVAAAEGLRTWALERGAVFAEGLTGARVTEATQHTVFATVPVDAGPRVLGHGAGAATLVPFVTRLAGGGTHRGFVADGARLAVVSHFLWPDPALDAPCFAMEVVVLGRKPVVFVIDTPVFSASARPAAAAAMDAARQVLDAARAAGGLAVVDDPDPPAWHAETSSGHDLCARPEPGALGALVAAQQAAFEAVIEAVARAPRRDAQAAETARQEAQAWRTHHALHSPGRPLLGRVGGEAWRDAVLEPVFG